MAKLQTVTKLTIHTRAEIGTTGAKAARRAGNVPGVLYGHGAPVAIAVDARELADLLATGGRAHIIDATIDGAHDSVLVRTVQRDPISRRPLAVDFQRVSQTEAIYATIPVHVSGVAPGVKDGGVLDMVTHALEVKGPAGKLPESLTIDVSTFGVGTHVTAGQVPLPAGFTLITPAETMVVSVEASRTAQSVADAPAPPAAPASTEAAPAE
jgi:large subunit ribosomal protein L25